MKKYLVIRSAHAHSDLDGICLYVSIISGDTNLANKIFTNITNKIKSLETFPERFQVINNAPEWLSGLRAMYVGKYIVYYVVDNTAYIVNIIRIVHSGIDISQLAID